MAIVISVRIIRRRVNVYSLVATSDLLNFDLENVANFEEVEIEVDTKIFAFGPVFESVVWCEMFDVVDEREIEKVKICGAFVGGLGSSKLSLDSRIVVKLVFVKVVLGSWLKTKKQSSFVVTKEVLVGSSRRLLMVNHLEASLTVRNDFFVGVLVRTSNLSM